MTDPPTDPPPADLELLDPDPAPPARGPHWERIVGLLLVVGIATAGLWQWVSAGTQHAAYRTAVQAETAQDWDRALVAYGQAGDYSDAPARRTNVTAAIHERDSAYATASAAYQRQDWATLLPALLPLERLAPTYRDTPRFIAARESAVYTPALSGTIALRPSAQPPGLYTYRTGWHWLTGSDIHSQIVGRCPNGDWLFDVALPPVPGATPLPTPPAIANRSVRLAARRLALVTPDGSSRLLLNPALNHDDFYICDSRQVWAMSAQQPNYSGTGQSSYMPIYTGTRQSLSGTQPQVPALPGPAWFFGAPSAADGAHILLVDETDLQLMHPQIGLAVADPDGSRLRALGTFSGTLQDNHFSPDGRWLLVTLNYNVPELAAQHNNPQQQRAILFDLTDNQAPRTLAQIERNGVNDKDTNYLYAFFLHQPPYSGRVLILSYGTSPRIQVIAPDGSAPDQTYAWPQPFYINSRPAIDSVGGQLLLSGTSSNPAQEKGRNQIAILTPPNTVTLCDVPMAPNQNIQGLGVRAEHLVYLAGEDLNYGVEATQAMTITSVPLTAGNDPARRPTLVYTGTYTIDNTQAVSSWYGGTDWLAYATPNGDLHARRYDGTGDVLLEHGVSSFTALYAYSSWDEP